MYYRQQHQNTAMSNSRDLHHSYMVTDGPNPDLDDEMENGVSKILTNPMEPIRREFSSRTDKAIAEYAEKKVEEEPQVSDLFLKTDVAGLPELYESRTTMNRILWIVVNSHCGRILFSHRNLYPFRRLQR